MTFTHFKFTNGIIAFLLFLVCVYFFKDDLYIYTSGVYLIRNGEISIYQLCIDFSRCLISFVASACFLYLTTLFRSIRKPVKDVICECSRYSLGIYCLSSIILTLLYKLMGKFNIDIPYNYISPFIITLIILTVCYSFFKFCESKKVLNLLFLGGR